MPNNEEKIRLITSELSDYLSTIEIPVEHFPENSTLLHGVESPQLYDAATNTLADQQWFTRDQAEARIYAADSGIILRCVTKKNTNLAVIRQVDIVNSDAFQKFGLDTNDLLKRVRNPIDVLRLPNAVSQFDYPWMVRAKRWYLLDALRTALKNQNLDGWVDYIEPNAEWYFREVGEIFDVEVEERF